MTIFSDSVDVTDLFFTGEIEHIQKFLNIFDNHIGGNITAVILRLLLCNMG